MDVLTSEDSSAAATYNNGDASGDPDPQDLNSDPSPYTGYGKDGKTAIHWESTTEKALSKCLGKGWTDFGVQSCSGKLQLSMKMHIPGTEQLESFWGKTVLPRRTGRPLAFDKDSILRLMPDIGLAW